MMETAAHRLAMTRPVVAPDSETGSLACEGGRSNLLTAVGLV